MIIINSEVAQSVGKDNEVRLLALRQKMKCKTMYKTIDIIDIIGSTIYISNKDSRITISELMNVVGRVETFAGNLKVDFSRRKQIIAREIMQDVLQEDDDTLVLPVNDEVRRRLVLKYFQLDKEIRMKLEQIIRKKYDHEI